MSSAAGNGGGIGSSIPTYPPQAHGAQESDLADCTTNYTLSEEPANDQHRSQHEERDAEDDADARHGHSHARGHENEAAAEIGGASDVEHDQVNAELDAEKW